MDTKKFVYRPLPVEAVTLRRDNFMFATMWCGGRCEFKERHRPDGGEASILVPNIEGAKVARISWSDGSYGETDPEGDTIILDPWGRFQVYSPLLMGQIFVSRQIINSQDVNQMIADPNLHIS